MYHKRITLNIIYSTNSYLFNYSNNYSNQHSKHVISLTSQIGAKRIIKTMQFEIDLYHLTVKSINKHPVETSSMMCMKRD